MWGMMARNGLFVRLRKRLGPCAGAGFGVGSQGEACRRRPVPAGTSAGVVGTEGRLHAGVRALVPRMVRSAVSRTGLRGSVGEAATGRGTNRPPSPRPAIRPSGHPDIQPRFSRSTGMLACMSRAKAEVEERFRHPETTFAKYRNARTQVANKV